MGLQDRIDRDLDHYGSQPDPGTEAPADCCETCINGNPGYGVMVECLVDREWRVFDHVCTLYEREVSQ